MAIDKARIHQICLKYDLKGRILSVTLKSVQIEPKEQTKSLFDSSHTVRQLSRERKSLHGNTKAIYSVAYRGDGS